MAFGSGTYPAEEKTNDKNAVDQRFTAEKLVGYHTNIIV